MLCYFQVCIIKLFSKRIDIDYYTNNGSASKSFASYVFLFPLVKLVEVRYTRNVSLKKNFPNLYTKLLVFFPLNSSQDVACHISERY